MLPGDFGEAFEELEDVERELDAAAVADSGKDIEAHPRNHLARSGSGKVSRKTEGRGIVARREVLARLGEAGPGHARVHEPSGGQGIDVVDHEAPVRPR